MDYKQMKSTKYFLDVEPSSPEMMHYLQEFLNSQLHISAIVNENKQVVLSNEALVTLTGMQPLENIVGKRPGKVLGCANLMPGIDCTETENCSFCGINRTLQQSQTEQRRVVSETRLSTRTNGQLISYDFQVVCSPLSFHGKSYTLINLVDISMLKRNEMLERVFYHDLLNHLGGLSGIVSILKTVNRQPELEEYIEILTAMSELTVEDIQTQQLLRAAESSKLIVDKQYYSAFEMLETVRKQLAYHSQFEKRKIVVCSECSDFGFQTDGALLKRILINMAKNAAEASHEHSPIHLICKRQDDMALFCVHNEGVIQQDIQKQIFQRSFSTKGKGRGLGTYSMKLFGENYLKGRVYFTSNKKDGTLFTIEIPLK
jgi:signal transduction histidine kinase